MIKTAIIILAFLLYQILVYYRYHNTKYVAVASVMSAAVAMVLLGGYAYFFEKSASFLNVNWIFYICTAYLIVGFILTAVASKKNGLNPKVDMTLSLIDVYLGRVFVYLAVLISIPAFFFIVMGTYRLMGSDHVYLWIILFVEWAFSGLRLVKNNFLKR